MRGSDADEQRSYGQTTTMKVNWDHKGTWLGLMLLLFLSGGLWITLSKRPADATGLSTETFPPDKGSQAPDLALQSLDGSTISLSDLKDQVVLINFWATWCPPCREEMPALQEIYDQYREQGFTVLAVNQHQEAAQVSPFVKDLGLTFPVLLDLDGQVARRYRVRALPTTFLVDRSGVIRETIVGQLLHARVEDQVSSLLAESSR
jgi:cytochrome c biogenesis protein CcmG/thiol:disulfide interchange protein DsbE